MPASRNRFIALDVFKTALIYGMVAAHIVQLVSLRLPTEAAQFSDFINLISFSGYMLAFGIGIGLPKGSGRGLLGRLWPALIMLVAVYVSSLGYTVLVARQTLTPALLTDLLTMRVLFGYSEFLASFLVLYIVIALARPVLVWIGETPRALVAVSMLCLTATLISTRASFPLIGAVIGSTNYASFPLIAYLPWFFVGIHFGSTGRKPDLLDYLGGLGASAPLIYQLWRTGELPQRFPPSLLWVIGPALALMIYWGGSRFLGRMWPEAGFFLLAPGRHVLAALVISNLTIFTIRHQMFKPIHTVPEVALAVLGVMALVTVAGMILDWIGSPRSSET